MILTYALYLKLKDYFANLCQDATYVEPTPVVISENVNVPEISEIQVWNNSRHLKKTPTGPDLIPYWMWKEHAEIMTLIVHKIWNLSLKPVLGLHLGREQMLIHYPKLTCQKTKLNIEGLTLHQ